jgi:large subunit ribosomal protein L9
VIPIAKVLLASNVDSLGHIGEIVNVADGYARNYLFPRGLAVEPTDHNIARFAKQRAAHEQELLQREEKARRLRDRLADLTLTFYRKAHDDDRLYGSVRAEDVTGQIASVLGEQIETSRVQMDHPIETLGPHSVTIGLYKDIVVEVRVQISEEGEKEG